MADERTRPVFDDEYREFERKMKLFEDGPTITHFEQLTSAGIQLPEPDAVADADIRTKLWEVLAGLAAVRVYIDHTDHLDDRQLYAELWHKVLREETPAVDEIGFNTHAPLLVNGDEAELSTYLKYYADDGERESWRNDAPNLEIPPPEDPPYNRDALLPCADYEFPDAIGWLHANWNQSAFASSRFATKALAIEFVEQLFAAGAKWVGIGNVAMPADKDWTPHSDTLVVGMPEDTAKHREVLALIERAGKPQERDFIRSLMNKGDHTLRIQWKRFESLRQ
jgi:hypothetical protein